MSISVVHQDTDKRQLGFLSDKEVVAEQIAELRSMEADDLMMKECRDKLRLTSPGVSDQSLRHLDTTSNTLVTTRVDPTKLREDGKPQFQPILLVTFQSLYE